MWWRHVLVLPFWLVIAASAQANCSKRPDSQIRPAVNSFLIRPESVLERYTRGERELSWLIRDIVAADPRKTLDVVIDLIRTANTYQRKAIGTGLGIAAKLCQQASAPDYAQRVLQAVRVRQYHEVTEAFFRAYDGLSTISPVVGPKNNDQQTNPLARPPIAIPEVDPCKSEKLPNPLTPLR
jgi:hypothetical protein